MKTIMCDICNVSIDSRSNTVAIHSPSTDVEFLYKQEYRSKKLDVCDECYSRILFLLFSKEGRKTVEKIKPTKEFAKYNFRELLHKAESDKVLEVEEQKILREQIEKILPKLPKKDEEFIKS